MFFRNVELYLQVHMALQPRRPTSTLLWEVYLFSTSKINPNIQQLIGMLKNETDIL
jgi:hypothetical protein